MRYVGLTERSVLQASSSCLRHVKSSSGAVTIGLSSPSSISSKGIAVGLSCWPQSRTGRRKRRSSPQHRTHSPSAALKRVEHLGASLSMLTSHSVPFGTIFGTAAASGSDGFALRSTRAFMLSQQCAPFPQKSNSPDTSVSSIVPIGGVQKQQSLCCNLRSETLVIHRISPHSTAPHSTAGHRAALS